MSNWLTNWMSVGAYKRSILPDLIETPDTKEASKPQRSKWWIPEGYYLSRVEKAERFISRLEKPYVKVRFEDKKLPVWILHPDYSYRWLWIRTGHSEFSPPPQDPSWIDGLLIEVKIADRTHDDTIYSTIRDGRLLDD